MLQHLPQLSLVVGFLVAFVASFSRIFAASKPFWARLPAWFQMLAPQFALTLGALGAGLAGGIKSWTDLTVVFVGAGALLLPGLPSNRSSAPLPSTKNPVKVPPLVGLMLCLVALCLTGCPAFSKVNWPGVVSSCVPSKDALVVEASDILLNDSAADYPGALEKLAETEGGEAVACAVNQIINQLGAATAKLTAAGVSAITRGKAFLASHGVKVESAQ